MSTPVKAIREYCLKCCCYSAQEVKLCPDTKCPLSPFRLGKNPNRSPRVLSEEQKQMLSEHLKRVREKRILK